MNVLTLALTCMLAAIGVSTGAAEPLQNSSTPASESHPNHRSISAIRIDVSRALRAEALTRRTGNNAPEVVRLIDLYREMADHPQRDRSPTLQELGVQVRLRLETVRKRIERRNSTTKRIAADRNLPAAAAKPATQVLAQQLPPPAAGAGPMGQGRGGAAATTSRATRQIDYGPDLVALIEQTISPATWDINGGNGSIVYFAPLHVLVVSAPDAVHGQIGGALGQLRAAQ
jgi:hypothetical protein